MGNNTSSHEPKSGAQSSSASQRKAAEAKSQHSQRLDHPSKRAAAAAGGTTTSTSTSTTTRSSNVVHFEHAPNTPSPSSSLTTQPPSKSPSPATITAATVTTRAQDIPTKPSKPVPISAGAGPEPTSVRSHSHRSSLDTSLPPTQDMSYHLTRPPRLPLPIEEEVHTPGSPIIPPADLNAPPLDLDPLESEGLTRKGSQTSNTTVDEEDEDGELQLDKTRAVVPTLVEWIGGSENSKVYVTGSIFSWNKKQRLHPEFVQSTSSPNMTPSESGLSESSPNRPGVFSANVHVRPGTHHLNFLIDGVMTTSTHLPTTVDFNNHLVNYIEVSPDDIPKHPSPPSSITKPTSAKPPPTPKMKPTIPLTSYTSEIPGYLEDLDLPEDSEPYQRAAAAIEKFPPPPSLPGFLGKPILNAATPMKDDNSVLVFPNHTVLNHLATSSIKSGILAVSATTRYKKKVCSQVYYRVI